MQTKWRKDNCVDHILSSNRLLKCVIEVKTEGMIVTRRRGRGCKQLLGDLTEKRGYCKLKGEAIDCIELSLEGAVGLS